MAMIRFLYIIYQGVSFTQTSSKQFPFQVFVYGSKNPACEFFRAGPAGHALNNYSVSCPLCPVACPLSVEKNVKNSSLVTNRAREVQFAPNFFFQKSKKKKKKIFFLKNQKKKKKKIFQKSKKFFFSKIQKKKKKFFFGQKIKKIFFFIF